MIKRVMLATLFVAPACKQPAASTTQQTPTALSAADAAKVATSADAGAIAHISNLPDASALTNNSPDTAFVPPPAGTNVAAALVTVAHGHSTPDIPGLVRPMGTVSGPGGAAPSRRAETGSVGLGSGSLADRGMIGDGVARERSAAPGSGAYGLGGMGHARPSVVASDEAAPAPSPTTATATAPRHAGTIPSAVAPMPMPPPPEQRPAAELTAASVGDTDRRENYLDYLGRHAEERDALKLDMSRRVRVRIVDAQGTPIADAKIRVNAGDQTVEGRSHADGWWDFFPSVSAPSAKGNATATAEINGQTGTITFSIPDTGDVKDPVTLTMPTTIGPKHPKVLDLGFVIDVTGSMGDELSYVNHEIVAITEKIKKDLPDVQVRLSATFYRDQTDSELVQQIAFGTDAAAFAKVMTGVSASGGGDYPEDLSAGVDAAMNRLAWSSEPAVRVMVLIADAPPQQYPNVNYTYLNAMKDASQRGIRVLPVAASGADRKVEYLFRAMGAFTSTPYTYLTDDSGIGGSHMEADTDRVGVEKFADLLSRLLISDLRGEGMHEPGGLPNAAPAAEPTPEPAAAR